MTDEREIIRCGSCQLNQFMTATGQCRKCGTKLEKPKEPVETAPPAQPAQQSLFWGTILLKLRTRRGLSQTKLAKKINRPRTFISKLERRAFPPTISTCLLLADGLNIKIEMLIGNADERREIIARKLMRDPFICEIQVAAAHLSREMRGIVISTARSLAYKQGVFVDYMQV